MRFGWIIPTLLALAIGASQSNAAGIGRLVVGGGEGRLQSDVDGLLFSGSGTVDLGDGVAIRDLPFDVLVTPGGPDHGSCYPALGDAA